VIEISTIGNKFLIHGINNQRKTIFRGLRGIWQIKYASSSEKTTGLRQIALSEAIIHQERIIKISRAKAALMGFSGARSLKIDAPLSAKKTRTMNHHMLKNMIRYNKYNRLLNDLSFVS
jgi:hypothetical protein